jgi:hypothetical protein
MATKAFLGKAVGLELHAELHVAVEDRTELADVLLQFLVIRRYAFLLGGLRDDLLFDDEIHGLLAQFLHQLQLITTGANLHALRVAVFDIEALEPLVADRLVVYAHGVTGVNALRLHRRHGSEQRK